MKTTIDIADGLLNEARKAAAEGGTTLRALVEEGLRTVLKTTPRKEPFRLRNAAFRGDGLQEPFEPGRWERIREAIYTGRGG